MPRSLWRWLTRRAPATLLRRTANRRPNARRQFALEALESRDVPAVMQTYHQLFAGGSGGSSPFWGPGGGAETLSQVRQYYGFNQITFNNGTVAGDGSGQTIAIVDAYDNPGFVSSTDPNFDSSNLHTFDTVMGLPDPVFTKVNQSGGISYPQTNNGWGIEEALDVEWAHAIAPGAKILLVEANSANDSDLLTAVDYARHAAGVVAVSMSWGAGEFSGETADDSHFTTPAGHGGVTFLASSGDSGAPPSWPAISANVLAVGGTSFSLDANDNITGESAWSGSGSGISTIVPTPSYQQGLIIHNGSQIVSSGGHRTNPDVSYDADPNSGFVIYNNGGWSQWGGTSDAAPQWAALVAIADQGLALANQPSLDGATQLLPKLYAMPASAFIDITSGSNNSYSAGPGYDLVTGLGSPHANVIVNSLLGNQGNGSASFVKSDTTTQGNWTTAYGADGYSVVGGSTSYPGYATVTPSGNSTWTWASSTTDVRAPWGSAAQAGRVAATWYSGGSFTIDLNVTDGQTHQVALYLLDWDNRGRSERIDITDAVTGKLLDSESAASFQNGDYLVWNVGGHVTIRLTNLSTVQYSNAVVSGLFFGTGTGGGGGGGNGSASFIKSDTTTQGNWATTYGADGYNVIGGSTSYPSYATVTPSGNSTYTWASSTTDVRAPWTSAAQAGRVAATWYNGASFTIDLNITDGQTHQVALYLLDWDNRGRSERIDITDAVTGKLLDSETGSSFQNGDYLVWTIGGHVSIRLTNLSIGQYTNAVTSGLFFGTGTGGGGGTGNGSASFVKSDSTTQGNWVGTYGADGYSVVGGTTNDPSYATVTPSGNSTYTWSSSTTDVSAPWSSAAQTGRVAATWYSATSFTINLDVTDGKGHQVALYLLDWDNRGRSERIDITDAVTGKLLDSESAASFQNGDYLVWDVGGNVNITLTNLSTTQYSNAVVSGLFFG